MVGAEPMRTSQSAGIKKARPSPAAGGSSRISRTLRSLQDAVRGQVERVEDWLLAEEQPSSASRGSQKPEEASLDDDLFGAQMHDYLSAGDLAGAAQEYGRLAGKGGDFETWLYAYMNEDERRSTVFWFNADLFSWVNAKYLLAGRHVPAALAADVLANAEALAEVVLGRVRWPLPRQGLAPSDCPGGVLVSLVYCSLDPDEVRPWVDHPQKCRLCLVYQGLLYSGFAWDFSRRLELNGQLLMLSEPDADAGE